MFVSKQDLIAQKSDQKAAITDVTPCNEPLEVVTRIIRPVRLDSETYKIDIPDQAHCIYQCQLIVRGENDILDGVNEIEISKENTMLCSMIRVHGLLFFHTQPHMIDLMAFFAPDEYITGWAGSTMKINGEEPILSEHVVLRITYSKQPTSNTHPFTTMKAAGHRPRMANTIQIARPRFVILRTCGTLDHVCINGIKTLEGKKLEITDVNNDLYPLIRSQKKWESNYRFYGLSFVPNVWQHRSSANIDMEPESIDLQYSYNYGEDDIYIFEVYD